MEADDLKLTDREKSLCIDYSLRIGTAHYHVLGKRRTGRRTKYDYYIVDDKLVRPKSNRKSSRPRYVVDADNRKKKAPRATSASPPRVQLDIEEIKKALTETMDAERDRIVSALRAAMVEDNETASQAKRDAEKLSTDLVKQTVKETLRAQNESSTPLEQLEERFVQTIERELQKIRLETETTQQEKEKAKKDEEERINQLFADQKQALTAVLNQHQQESETTSLARIQNVVTETLQLQQSQQEQQNLVFQQGIQQLEIRLSKNILEMVSAHKTIKIIDDINSRVLVERISEPAGKEKNKSTNGSGHTDTRSSTKQKQTSTDKPTQQQSTVADNRNENPELEATND